MQRARQVLLLLVLLGLTTPIHAQNEQPQALRHKASIDASPIDSLLTVDAGKRMFLQLEMSLNTNNAQVGDPVEFKTTEDMFVGDAVAIPRGSVVSGKVSKVHRPGRLKGLAEIGLKINQVTLTDGTSHPLTVSLLHAGFAQVRPGKDELRLKGESGNGLNLMGIAQGGIQGAVLGGAIGGAVGLGIGFFAELFQRGPDLDLPEDMMFEVALLRPLHITASESQRALHSVRTVLPDSSHRLRRLPADPLSKDPTEPVPDFRRDEHSKQPGKATTDVATASTRVPAPRPGDTQQTAPVFEDIDRGEFSLKVDVQLVTVDALVRNRSGRPMDNLHKEDFRVFEDGIEQPITSFSRDTLPLAVALVVDRSGSVILIMNALRRAAYQTLSHLKPGDQVALFAFADRPQRLEGLTTDRQRIADRIATIKPGGGTNINDALFDAIHYLSVAAQDRRRAVILVSDNEVTTKARSSERKLIRLAAESETVVYSIRLAGEFGSSAVSSMAPWFDGAHSVAKVTLETGGEIVDITEDVSLSEALAAVISRLRLRYALGYQPARAYTSDAFRKIDVRLADRFGRVASDYSIRARRGYYPATPQVATHDNPRP